MPYQRILPALLLDGGGLYKTVRFKSPKYIGDPINTVKIFNAKFADELCILDIGASAKNRINYDLIGDIVSEAFMPITYGGGIKTLSDVESLFSLGVDKVAISGAAFVNPNLVKEAVNIYGTQSIITVIDYKKTFFKGYKVYVNRGNTNTSFDPIAYCLLMQDLGVGEIILQSIDRDGTFTGYDLALLSKASSILNIPITALGGASSYNDINELFNINVSGAAAGSLFSFARNNRDSVLINYPQESDIPRLKI